MLEILNLMVDQGLGNIREIAYQVRLGVRRGVKPSRLVLLDYVFHEITMF